MLIARHGNEESRSAREVGWAPVSGRNVDGFLTTIERSERKNGERTGSSPLAGRLRACQAMPLARVLVATRRSDSSGCCASYMIQSLAATGDTTVA